MARRTRSMLQRALHRFPKIIAQDYLPLCKGAHHTFLWIYAVSVKSLELLNYPIRQHIVSTFQNVLQLCYR